MRQVNREAILTSSYHNIYKEWKSDPQGFWANAAEQISWDRTWDKVFDESRNVYGEWFAGARCNTCYNCLDRQVEDGRGDQAAIIYDSPITGEKRTYTYFQLLEEVEALASVLTAKGITKGDRVIIYLPMVPQAATSMLACARIGAIHSVVFGGFAAAELATRINDATPKMIISASCGIEPGRVIAYKPLLDEAIELANSKPTATLILQREQSRCDLIPDRDFDYEEVVNSAIASGV
jgi:propionyl-CoA synthetase